MFSSLQTDQHFLCSLDIWVLVSRTQYLVKEGVRHLLKMRYIMHRNTALPWQQGQPIATTNLRFYFKISHHNCGGQTYPSKN